MAVFLPNPAADLPEHLIGADPRYYLHYTLGEWCATPGIPALEAVAEYARCFTPAAIPASCEDDRAGVDRPSEPAWGAGEPVTEAIPEAIGNAIFDATGIRIRSLPFTPARVLAALAAAS